LQWTMPRKEGKAHLILLPRGCQFLAYLGTWTSRKHRCEYAKGRSSAEKREIRTPKFDTQNTFELAENLVVGDGPARLIILQDARLLTDLLSHVLLSKPAFKTSSGNGLRSHRKGQEEAEKSTGALDMRYHLTLTLPTEGAILAGGATSFSLSKLAIRRWSGPESDGGRVSSGQRGKNTANDSPWWALFRPEVAFLLVATIAPTRRA
jgi:hypothetical protein